MKTIKRPKLEHYEYMDGSVRVIALTNESNKAWADYLRAITISKHAL